MYSCIVNLAGRCSYNSGGLEEGPATPCAHNSTLTLLIVSDTDGKDSSWRLTFLKLSDSPQLFHPLKQFSRRSLQLANPSISNPDKIPRSAKSVMKIEAEVPKTRSTDCSAGMQTTDHVEVAKRAARHISQIGETLEQCLAQLGYEGPMCMTAGFSEEIDWEQEIHVHLGNRFLAKASKISKKLSPLFESVAGLIVTTDGVQTFRTLKIPGGTAWENHPMPQDASGPSYGMPGDADAVLSRSTPAQAIGGTDNLSVSLQTTATNQDRGGQRGGSGHNSNEEADDVEGRPEKGDGGHDLTLVPPELSAGKTILPLHSVVELFVEGVDQDVNSERKLQFHLSMEANVQANPDTKDFRGAGPGCLIDVSELRSWGGTVHNESGASSSLYLSYRPQLITFNAATTPEDAYAWLDRPCMANDDHRVQQQQSSVNFGAPTSATEGGSRSATTCKDPGHEVQSMVYYDPMSIPAATRKIYAQTSYKLQDQHSSCTIKRPQSPQVFFRYDDDGLARHLSISASVLWSQKWGLWRYRPLVYHNFRQKLDCSFNFDPLKEKTPRPSLPPILRNTIPARDIPHHDSNQPFCEREHNLGDDGKALVQHAIIVDVERTPQACTWGWGLKRFLTPSAHLAVSKVA